MLGSENGRSVHPPFILSPWPCGISPSFGAAGRRAAVGNISRIRYVADLAAAALIAPALSATRVSTHLYDVPGTASLMMVYALSLPFYSLLGTSLAVLSAYEFLGIAGVSAVGVAAFTLLMAARAMARGARQR